jgi:hypothetical protein
MDCTGKILGFYSGGRRLDIVCLEKFETEPVKDLYFEADERGNAPFDQWLKQIVGEFPFLEGVLKSIKVEKDEKNRQFLVFLSWSKKGLREAFKDKLLVLSGVKSDFDGEQIDGETVRVKGLSSFAGLVCCVGDYMPPDDYTFYLAGLDYLGGDLCPKVETAKESGSSGEVKEEAPAGGTKEETKEVKEAIEVKEPQILIKEVVKEVCDKYLPIKPYSVGAKYAKGAFVKFAGRVFKVLGAFPLVKSENGDLVFVYALADPDSGQLGAIVPEAFLQEA